MALASKKYQFRELPKGLELVVPFGKYKVLGGIAVGRCCEVYEGEDSVQGCRVAIKVFRRHQLYQGAMQRELFFLRSLADSGAPIVSHVGEVQWEGRDILIQELLGPTLRELLLAHEQRPCSPWLITTLTTHLLRGLQYLHEKGVVHGDLKPPNILWDGDAALFKLIDFGVSFTTSEDLTHAVQSKGYQAPECVTWNRAVAEGKRQEVVRPGPAADIWSVGCIVTECLVMRQPCPVVSWQKDVPGNLQSALSALKPNFSLKFLQEAYTFLSRCLQVNPEERVAAGSLLKDSWLQHLLRPSLCDLLHIPSRVLRFLGLLDSHKTQDIEASLVMLCRKYGTVCGYHLEAGVDHLYVAYKSTCQAEAAQDQLNGSTHRGRTLVVTFYPPESWHQREFY